MGKSKICYTTLNSNNFSNSTGLQRFIANSCMGSMCLHLWGCRAKRMDHFMLGLYFGNKCTTQCTFLAQNSYSRYTFKHYTLKLLVSINTHLFSKLFLFHVFDNIQISECFGKCFTISFIFISILMKPIWQIARSWEK